MRVATSSLEPRARRMVAAMNLRVTVLARTADHARALRASLRRRGGGLRRVVEEARVAGRHVMTLLAQIGPRSDEEHVVVRAVRLMTIGAALAHRRVLPQERPTLLRVARI